MTRASAVLVALVGASLVPLCASLQVCQPSSMVACRHGAVSMAGFGAAPKGKGSAKGKKGAKSKKAAAPPSAELSPKRQWDRFKELVSGGAPRTAVFASLDDKWTEVGDVAVASPGTPEQAAQFNKRLILEHAPRVKPALRLRARELVVGIVGADGEPVALAKQEVPADLESGFEGAPDSSGMYSHQRGTTRTSDPTAIVGSAAR